MSLSSGLRTVAAWTCRSVSTSAVSLAGFDRSWTYRSLPKRDEGTAGEKTTSVALDLTKDSSVFPEVGSDYRLFDGVPYKDLPICTIRVSKNNAIFTISDSKGAAKVSHSCGAEGFKNARKGTNIAAQATGISAAIKAREKGIQTIRVRVDGLGAGRTSSIKGLQMGGMNIVSITDSTRVSWSPPRPRKARRI